MILLALGDPRCCGKCRVKEQSRFETYSHIYAQLKVVRKTRHLDESQEKCFYDVIRSSWYYLIQQIQKRVEENLVSFTNHDLINHELLYIMWIGEIRILVHKNK